MKFLTILSLVMISFSVSAFAMGTVDKGQEIPTDLALYDQYGGERSFDNLVGSKGLVLVFFRSADWCPYCKAQLIDLRNKRKQFENAGYPVVAISYDDVDILGRFNEEYDPGFTLLSDPGSKTIEAFGLKDEQYQPGSFAFGVPKPAIFIVNKDKFVTDILAEDSYKVRPQVEVIIKAIYNPE